MKKRLWRCIVISIEYYDGIELKDKVIWRYMDIIKFVDLISNKKIYFSSISEFNDIDPHDSKLPVMDRIQFNYLYEFVSSIEQRTGRGSNTYYCNLDKCIEYLRQFIGINCWFISDYENYSMWKTYSDIRFGIAIRTTIEDLKKSLVNNDQDTILFGEISYDTKGKADDIADTIQKNIYYPFFTKRKEYINENELRIIMSKSKSFKIDFLKNHKVTAAVYAEELVNYLCLVAEQYDEIKNNKKKINNYLSVDIKTLIKEVHIAPNAPEYFIEVVNSIIKKFKLTDIEIKKSTFFKY